MVDFQTFLITVGGSTAISGFVLYYLQERTKSDFAKKLEETRASLREQTDIRLLQMNAELDASATERSLRFSKTPERTADVIANVYRQILELQWAINEFAEPFAPFWCIERGATEGSREGNGGEEYGISAIVLTQ